MKTKIGVFSGTFDPVHTGHVAFALQAIETCALERVIFLPEKSPRVKTPTAFTHRLAMLQSALNSQTGLSLELLSTDQFDVAQTLPELAALLPGKRLVFLLGSDVITTFSYRWPGLDVFLRSVDLAIGMRSQDSLQAVEKILQDCALQYGITPHYTIIPSPHAHLASTQIRQGTHLITDLDPAVAAYIRTHQLYADASGVVSK